MEISKVEDEGIFKAIEEVEEETGHNIQDRNQRISLRADIQYLVASLGY